MRSNCGKMDGILWARDGQGRGIAAPGTVGVGYSEPGSEWVREALRRHSGRRDGGAHPVQAPADLGGQCGDLGLVHQLQDGFRVHEGDDDGVVRLLVPLRCRAEWLFRRLEKNCYMC